MSPWGRFVERVSAGWQRRVPAKSNRRPRLALESLESRVVPAVFELGELVGRRFFNDAVDDGSSAPFRDEFNFTFSDPAVLDVQFSPDDTGGAAELQVFSLDADGNRSPPLAQLVNGSLRLSLPAGDFRAEVPGSAFGPLLRNYRLALAADRAPGSLFAQSLDFRGDLGRDLGTLSAVNPTTANDFIGYLHSSARPGRDLIDTYFFDIPVFGTVTATLDGLLFDAEALELPDTQFPAVAADVFLFRDIDQDGRLEAGEALDTDTASPGQVASFQRQLNAGRYAVVVSRLGPVPSLDKFGGSDYRLQLAYAVADSTGNTLAEARNIGGLGGNPQTFAEYLSSADNADVYRFSTSGDGPFVFDARVTDLPTGADFDIQLIRDGNGNGQVNVEDVLAQSSLLGPADEAINASITVPGTYFLRVRHLAGEGPYSLLMTNRNTDLAGGTLQLFGHLQAEGLAGYEGRSRVSDFLSATDTADVFRFTTTNAGTLQASFPATASGTNANLSLIQDLDGDQVIDPEDVIAVSNNTGNAGESITRSLAPGVYFMRVSRAAGSPFYDLTVNLDTAGDTAATARHLFLNGGVGDNAWEFLGPGDATDLYVVNLTQPRRLSVGLGFLTAPVVVALGLDGNGNGALDRAETVLEFNTGTAYDLARSVNLTATGKYLVRVTPTVAEGHNYAIQVAAAPIDGAGDTMAAARDLGTLFATQSFADFVGDGTRDFADDPNDFYRFTLGNNGPYTFVGQLVVSSLSTTARMELIRDVNLNGQIDEGETLAASASIPLGGGQFAPPNPIITTLSDPGVYYLRVLRTSGQVGYTLHVSASSQDTVGNTPAAATDLGALGQFAPRTVSQFIGALDRDDFYRFSVGAAGSLQVALNSLGSGLAVEVIRDADSDLVIDPGETLASSADPPEINDLLNGVFLPAAGTYFLRVLSNGQNAAYTATLLFSGQRPFGAGPIQVSPTDATTIQAEHYDIGGEDIAYNDTTAGNAGGQLRSDNVDIRAISAGGFFVSDTAAGEFLEYTLLVPVAGQYDFEFRVSGAANGASFHAEIDFVDVTGPLAVPNTSDDLNFVTVSRAGVFLAAGPQVLRIEMDTAAGGQVGSYDFIRITPTVGAFGLTSPETTVATNERTLLSLAWTVPFGGWRVLNEVHLRLRDAGGTVLWVKFDEAANTLSLFDPATGRFGPAKELGSHGVLSNGAATIYLRTSRVRAAGPTAPTVELLLDVSFHRSVRGRRFAIEVAASNDRGQAQPFQSAGFLSIAEE